MAEDTVEYRFTAPEDVWRDWADSVPRSKNLDARLLELIEKDTPD